MWARVTTRSASRVAAHPGARPAGRNVHNAGMHGKDVVRSIPVLGAAATRIGRAIRRRRFAGSASYWESRYQTGGTSGAGSYNRLAEFKARMLNDFVRERDVKSVLELGCGDGAQLELTEYPRYIGCDVSAAAVEMCRARYANDPSKEFLLLDELPTDLSSDLALSLDVVYHLVEDEVFAAHMATLFDHADRFVIIYSSNQDSPQPTAHVRHRRFTDWVDTSRPNWRLSFTVPNAYPFDPKRSEETSFADFFVYERVA